MSRRIEELDWRRTPMGELTLRRRWDPLAGRDVFEIRLNDEFLMSSMFTAAEIEMARLAMRRLPQEPVDIAVGGLGLGYTAQAVLEHPHVRSLVVVEALGEVIEWHERGLIPAGAALSADPRCRFVHGDFFALVAGGGPDPDAPARRFHAVLVDIDHSPRHLLDPAHADFYRPGGLRALARHLHPGGVFALWSNDPPDEEFTASLAQVFADIRAEVVPFANPLQEREATNTVYLASVEAYAD